MPLEHWRAEMRSALLYRVLAETEKGTSREALFADLARAAEAQGAIWAEAARGGGEALPSLAPGLRVRIAAFLIRRFGPRRIRPVLAALKVRGLSVYSGKAPGHEMPTTIEDVGARHTGAGSGGNLRAAVFGVNDGLVSNLALVLGGECRKAGLPSKVLREAALSYSGARRRLGDLFRVEPGAPMRMESFLHACDQLCDVHAER